ncbi:hypothetical protein [Polaribacter ponticola]|uniref:Adhesin domain-containing protein n=1 Tax=Polaribacter ponticola TaxID=2978475 RepID=A0ABT5S9R8_9FLAO|nr:hypothetical protein [Polaribacter sp. MSW5]MDD7914325.1 hypothetical protein [Polaribacter sp. MSW5]
MKLKLYKSIFYFFAICMISTTYAQKFDKKYTENFKVNKNVEVAINASNTDINVTTWNKNEVIITAFIEVQGVSKEEAEKYFKNWNFEALGNKNKVQITSKGNSSSLFKNDFLVFNDMDIQIPKFDSIIFPNIKTIVLPEMNFDFDFDLNGILEGMDNLDEIVGKDGKYSFQWNDGDTNININSKKDWEAFKKTKKYKELKKKLTIDKAKMKKEFAESKEQMKKELAKAKLEIKKIDKEKIKAELLKAKEELQKLKLNFSSDSKNLIIDGKKVKIKKRLEIKVPKNATFDLNTRHCKVKLPSTVASGNVNYGAFNANSLNGGKLTINYSPVLINNLSTSNLFLNNVIDAKIASITNTKLSNNSSRVNIEKINQNVEISDRFGELIIQNIIPNYKMFHLILDNSDAKLNLSTANEKLKFMSSSIMLPKKISDHKKSSVFNGHIRAHSNDNTFRIEGENSKLTIIKENL